MNSETISKFLSRFIKVGLYLALLMPFIYVDNLVFPFITGKIFIFQILIEILFAAYLILIYINPLYRPRKTTILFAVGVFIASWIVSTIVGVDADRSFWGNYERMSGTFTILHFFIYFLMLGSVLHTRRQWYSYISFAVFVSGIQAIIGIVQYYSSNLFLAQGGGRIWGTLGNYIYLATYSIFHIFLALMLLFARDDIPRFFLSKKIRYAFFGSIIVLNIIALYFSGTRGGYIGFLSGIIFSLTLIIIATQSKKLRIITLCIMSGLVGIGILAFVLRSAPFTSKVPIVGALARLSISADTGFTRLIGWEIAIKGWKERPVFGWGPENYYYAFNKYFNPRSLERGYYETWFDRPHNMVLDVLATQGAFGLVAYIAIFLSIVVLATKRLRQGAISFWEFIFPLGGIGAYFVQNLFVFDQPSSFLLFYVYLAWFHGIARRMREGAVPEIAPRSQEVRARPLMYMIGALSVGFLSLVYIGTFEPWLAGTATIRAERALGSSFEDAFRLYKKAVLYETPYQDDVQLSMARIVHDRAQVSKEFIDAHKDKLLFVIEQLEDFRARHPTDVYPYMTLGEMYVVAAQMDPYYFVKANEVLQRASELSPGRQQVYYVWARIKVVEGKLPEAQALLKKALDLDSQVSESHWYLGIILNIAGRKQEAMNHFEKARTLNYQWKSTAEILLMASVAEELGEVAKIPPLLEEAAQISNQAEVYLMLARAYKQVNDIPASERALAKAIELNPKILNGPLSSE